MFAVVRTGGKQYRVAEGDKIAVEKLAGDAGDTIELGDVLLAGEGGELAEAGKVKVAAEIIAQARSEKVIVFKKRRRHNYRRKAGHRQYMTLLRITSVGEEGRQAAPATLAATNDQDVQAGGEQPQPGEPVNAADVTRDEAAHTAAPVKDAAESKPADGE